MNIKLSRRALTTPPSPIRKLTPLQLAAQKNGVEVLHLNIGQPDITPPEAFWQGYEKSLLPKGLLGYESSQGSLRLCQAWASFFSKTLNLDLSATEIIITAGASEALVFSFMVACDPGDEIIIFDPTYANYQGFAAVAGVKLVAVQSSFEKNFALPELEEIVACFTPRSKAILLCNPNNPSGRHYTQDEVSLLLKLAKDRNILFIVDETYRELVFQDRQPFSALNIKDDHEHLIVVDSLSKRFNICGARIGGLISKNQEIIKYVQHLAQSRLAVASLEQQAAAALLEHFNPEQLKALANIFYERSQALISQLRSSGAIQFVAPEGAFYLIARLPEEVNGEDFAKFLLNDFSQDNTTVFVTPGSGFFLAQENGFNYLRLAYVLSPEKLATAGQLLVNGLASYLSR
jgi:aspartate aminotransferase